MRFALYLVLAVLFYACDPSIRFEQPQPLNGKNELSFSSKYIGKYMNDDSVQLVIDKSSIVITKKMAFRMLKSDIDSSVVYKLKKDSVYNSDLKITFPVKIKKDTVLGRWNYKDTIFSLSATNVLRHFNGAYFLNMKTEAENWEVKRICFDERKRLLLNTMYMQDDLELLKDVTHVKEIKKDSASASVYIVNPSKKELRKFIKNGGFQHNQRFTKIQ